MSDIEDIRAAFRDRAVLGGRELYLLREDAIGLVDECNNTEVAVGRVEGFVVEDGAVMASTSMIADYPTFEVGSTSWQEHVKKSCALARDFIVNTKPETELMVFSRPHGSGPANGTMIFAFVLELSPGKYRVP